MAAHDDTTPVMMDLANYSVNETLRDGRTVEIRSQRSQDRESMHAAIARFSSGTLYRRFFGVRRQFSEKETDYFLDIDFVNHVALVVVANDGGEPTIVGGGRYVVVQPGQAEVAFAIIDAYQGLERPALGPKSEWDSRIGEILIQPAGWAEASRRWQSRIRKICATG